MSYGHDQRGVLSACAAEFLAVHTYFNPDSPIEEGPPPTVELTSSNRYQPGTTSVPVRLKVSDSEGLHHVSLVGNAKPCRGLADKTEAVVEFDYDGHFWQRGFTNLSDQTWHHMLIVAVDADGNVSETYSSLTESSPYEVATLEGHTEGVSSVAFSPDGTLLASGSDFFYPAPREMLVRLWDVASQREVARLEGHTWFVRSVAFSPDGTLLASGSDELKLWNVATREEIANLYGGAYVAFSPDGATLAAGGGSTDVVYLWDVPTRELVATLGGYEWQINAVAFSPDGTLLATGSGHEIEGEGAVKLWDVESQSNIAIFELSYGATSVAFSPDGATLAAGVDDGTARLWDVARRIEIATLEGLRAISSVAFSPDGTILASTDINVKLWNVGTLEQIAVFPGHLDWISSVSFSPDSRTLATGSFDRTVKLWDISEWKGPRPFGLEIISGDGQQGSAGAALAQPLVVEVRDQHGDPLPEAHVTFTVTAGEGRLSGRFTVEHTTTDASGRAELPLTLGPHRGSNIVGVSLGRRELAEFSAEGVGTTVAELDGDYRTWHLPEAATVRLGKGAIGEGDRSVALSADGRFLAVASALGVWLYEAATSRALALLPSADPVHSVAFSLDGTLAAGLHNGQVELWEVETGERITTLRHADWDRVASVAFSRDGTALASGSWDQVIKVWDVETRREVGTWEVARDSDSYWNISVAFSPDGTRLVSGFQDGTVRLWDIATQTELATLEGHTDRVTSVSFSPDGGLLASAGGRNDAMVRLWDAATQTEVAPAEGAYGRGPFGVVFFA